jgi:hypothetical protein
MYTTNYYQIPWKGPLKPLYQFRLPPMPGLPLGYKVKIPALNFKKGSAGVEDVDSGTVHYTPYTIHHTPHTIHHTPYTIHHTLYTIHHTPYTTHYTPYTILMAAPLQVRTTS